MIQGLSIGLSAFGTSIATGGREGGAKEVAEIQGEEQRQQLEKQQGAMAQRNAQVQQQLTIAGTNDALVHSYLNLMTVPMEMDKSHVELESAKLGVTGQQLDIRQKGLQDYITTGDPTMLQQAGIAAPTGPGVAPAGTNIPPAAMNAWKNATDSAISAYPNDPTIKQYAAVLADSNSTSVQMAQAANGAKNRMEALDKGAASRKAQAEASTAETTAKYAGPKTQADIAKARAQAASADSSRTKNTFELGQEQREAQDLATPDAVGFSSKLTPKEYEKRYDAFTKSKDYQTLSTLKGSYQQFNDTLNHIAATGDMNGAESVVGLFNAIGISATPLAGKGFRINANTVEEHQEARGIDQAAYQKLLALKNGDVITPQQLKDYANISAGVYYNSYVNAADEAHRQGLPVDFLPQGGGQTLDPITARIYTDVVLHTNPSLAKNPQALKDAIKSAVTLNGWRL